MAVLTASLLAPGVANAATARIYVNLGVKTARLGMYDVSAAARLGRVVRKSRDNSYAGRVVWVRYFGRKVGGKYPLELYSNRSHRVFAFVINGRSYVTMRGIRVGSSETALTTAYGTALTPHSGPVYNRYTLGGRKGTDFYVRDGLVKKIVVRTY